MDVLTSTEFRKRYATLKRPTAVTVNGHTIGVWHPGNPVVATDALRSESTTSTARFTGDIGGRTYQRPVERNPYAEFRPAPKTRK